jgi:Tol biopolymer transport system component
MTVEQTFPDFKDGGMIALSGYIGYSGESFSDLSYLYNMETRNLIPLPQEPGRYILSFSFMVSPDRSHLAYVQENDNYTNMDLSRDPYLYIVTSTGAEEKKYQIQISNSFEWLDENHIILEQMVSGDGNSITTPNGTTVDTAPHSFAWFLMNTTTGEMQELQSKFPDQILYGQIVSFPASRLIYSSTHDRVIYPAALPNTVLRLYDVTKAQVIADVSTTDFGKFHVWSPDDKRIAFATNTGQNGRIDDELFVLDNTGALTQLTHLSDSEFYSKITGLSWSPDGSQIAYWVDRYNRQSESNSSHLFVTNTITRESRQFCDIKIPGGDYFSNMENPVWSPDGKYLLATLTNSVNEQNTIVIIIDITSGKAYRIGDDFRAVGWLR